MIFKMNYLPVLNIYYYMLIIEEIKTICWYCHKKASMNMRVVDGKPVYTGEQIQIGGNESYYPVCRYHYSHPGEQRA